MAVELRLSIREQRKEWLGSQRAFNELARKALTRAAQHWIEHMLPLHLAPGAAGYYGFGPNSGRWWALKGRASRWPDSHGVFQAVRKPPQIMVMTGEQQDAIRARMASGLNIVATATGATAKNPEGKFRVQVKVPTEHPINPRYAGFYTKLLPAEFDVLAKVAARELVRLMAEAAFGADGAVRPALAA